MEYDRDWINHLGESILSHVWVEFLELKLLVDKGIPSLMQVFGSNNNREYILTHSILTTL